MRPALLGGILAMVALIVSPRGPVRFGAPPGSGVALADKHESRSGEKKDKGKGERHKRSDRDDDDNYDEDGPPGTASTESSSGGRGRAGSGLTRGPYLQMVTPGGITVRWRTGVPAGSCVRYGTDPGRLEFLKETPGETNEHEVRLAELRPYTRYYYSVGDRATVLAAGQDCSFVTSPPLGAVRRVRVWILGDSGAHGSAQDRVLQAYDAFTNRAPADVWLLVGDNAYDAGTSLQYRAGFFTPFRARLRSIVAWPARGNHDLIRKGPDNDYYDFFTLPAAGEAGGTPSNTEAWYSFDYANVHFVCLDAERLSGSTAGAMLEWLRHDLAATRQEWLIAYWHHPPYSKGSHDSDSDDLMTAARRVFLPVLEQGGVDLVVCGHSHSYERSFLLDGHYGPSATLDPAMILDRGDGRADGNGPYRKPTYGRPAPHEGAVYVVVGSSSKTGGGRLDHPAMAKSLNALGSLVLDISGDRLDAAFAAERGRVADRFTIVKGEAPSAGRGRVSSEAPGGDPRDPRADSPGSSAGSSGGGDR